MGIEALNKTLGPERAKEFLALIHCEPMCWIEISKMLYEGQSVEEIFKRAKEHWRGWSLNPKLSIYLNFSYIMYPFPTPERIHRGTGLQEFYAESKFAEILAQVEACLQQ